MAESDKITLKHLRMSMEKCKENDNNLQQGINGLDSQIKDKANNSDLEVERKRINSFTSLAEGSTTGDAELIDARIGADGVTYDNLGTAIRSQFSNLSAEDIRCNASDVVNLFNPDATPIFEDRFYMTSNGDTQKYQTFYQPAMIACKPGDVIRQGRYSEDGSTLEYSTLNSYLSCFDKDGNMIAFVNLQSNTTDNTTIPSNDKICYFSIPARTEYKYKTLITINQELPDKFVAYGVASDNVCTVKDKLDSLEELINTLDGGNSVGGNHWKGKTWYAYGTSITNTSSEGRYATYLAKLGEFVHVNKGISGGGICSNKNIKNAIMNTTDGKLNADLITLEVTANDSSCDWGTIYDSEDTDTFCGNLTACIKYLQENTDAQIVVMSSPIMIETTMNSNVWTPPGYRNPSNGLTIYDKNRLIEDVCRLHCVYYIPLGECGGMGYYKQKSHMDLTQDGIHPSDLGGYNIAQFVWSRLKDIPLWYTQIPTE